MDYLAFISVIFYLFSGLLATRQLFSTQIKFDYKIIVLSIITFALHVTWLYQHIFVVQGQDLPILNVVSLVSFLIALFSLIISKNLNTGILLPIVYGFNILNFIALIYLPSHYITNLENNPQVGSHIIFALLAYAMMSIASLFALLLAYVDYRLKQHKSPINTLNIPPLMTLEKSLFQFIFIGFVLLTCTLLTGFVFLEDMFAAENAHKTVLSIAAWIIYSVLLWGHYKKGWRGRLVIYITIIGSSFLTLAYFGSRFVREVILLN
jgi:ABC-type uncharacterized transport system permease subunit